MKNRQNFPAEEKHVMTLETGPDYEEDSGHNGVPLPPGCCCKKKRRSDSNNQHPPISDQIGKTSQQHVA